MDLNDDLEIFEFDLMLSEPVDRISRGVAVVSTPMRRIGVWKLPEEMSPPERINGRAPWL